MLTHSTTKARPPIKRLARALLPLVLIGATVNAALDQMWAWALVFGLASVLYLAEKCLKRRAAEVFFWVASLVSLAYGAYLLVTTAPQTDTMLTNANFLIVLGFVCALMGSSQNLDHRIARLEAPMSEGRAHEYPGIYRITCRANGKEYIGQSSRPMQDRWRQHRYDLDGNRHFNRWLQDDWNRYRPEQFVFEALEVVTDPVWLFERERYWQDMQYDASRRYNPPNIASRPAKPLRPKLVRHKSPPR